jgi:hypothetical protein
VNFSNIFQWLFVVVLKVWTFVLKSFLVALTAISSENVLFIMTFAVGMKIVSVFQKLCARLLRQEMHKNDY